MSEMGVRSKIPKPYKNCTDSTHSEKTAPNILNRNFATDILGSVWVSDITYIPDSISKHLMASSCFHIKSLPISYKLNLIYLNV